MSFHTKDWLTLGAGLAALLAMQPEVLGALGIGGSGAAGAGTASAGAGAAGATGAGAVGAGTAAGTAATGANLAETVAQGANASAPTALGHALASLRAPAQTALIGGGVQKMLQPNVTTYGQGQQMQQPFDIMGMFPR